MDKIPVSIEKAFDNDKESLKDFHASVAANLTETEKSLKKVVYQLILFVLGFFIISQSSVQEIEIGPFKINNLNIIIKIFPLIIAYKFYEFLGLQCFTRCLNVTHNETIAKLYPKTVENNLQPLITPESIVNTQEFFELRNSNGLTKIMENLRLIILIMQLLIMPLAFIAYAIYLNFYRFGFKDVLVWIISLMVLLLLIQSAILFVENNNQDIS